MNILILANYDYGLYIFRKELLQELVKENHAFVSVPLGKYNDKIRELGCEVIETSFNRRGTNPIADLKLIKNYKTIIRNTKPDVVLTYTIKPNVYGGIACQQQHVPYIANITGLGSALENGGLLQVITINLYKMGLKRAQMVFFQNESNKDFMISHKIVKNNYDLLPGSGVNLEHYKLLEWPNKETIDFVYVGRIMKLKGFDQYAKAAEVIRSKYKNARFHVCGFYEDDYKDIVERLVKDNVLIYHGVIEDMRTIYKDVNCTVHPSFYPEGLSNVLLESLASGRPIITTDRPGCKEVVDDGVNGFMVKQKDTEDLINKIEKFISLSKEERKQMGINGREKVEKYFDRNIVIAKYLREIKNAKKI